MSEIEPEPDKTPDKTPDKKKRTYRIIMVILALAVIGIGIWQIIRGMGQI